MAPSSMYNTFNSQIYGAADVEKSKVQDLKARIGVMVIIFIVSLFGTPFPVKS